MPCSKDQIRQLLEQLQSYLDIKLQADTNELSEKDFQLVTVNQIAIIILRNASRSGTIITMRNEYINKQNLYISKSHDRVAIESAPVSVTEARKRPGERKRLENILKILERSHQNFFCDGIRYQVVKKQEMDRLRKYRDIKEKQCSNQTYLFAPMTTTESWTYEEQKIS